MSIQILIGDCRVRLREMLDASVDCCVTSPPYFGLRDYGVDGQMGLEATPDEFVAGMVAVFREVHRVLRDDGTLWLDPFGGAGTTGLVADRLQRRAILIELNPAYVDIAARRIAADGPLLSRVARA